MLTALPLLLSCAPVAIPKVDETTTNTDAVPPPDTPMPGECLPCEDNIHGLMGVPFEVLANPGATNIYRVSGCADSVSTSCDSAEVAVAVDAAALSGMGTLSIDFAAGFVGPVTCRVVTVPGTENVIFVQL